MPQHVQRPFVGVTDAVAAGCLAAAELAAQSDFALGLGFVGEQARRPSCSRK